MPEATIYIARLSDDGAVESVSDWREGEALPAGAVTLSAFAAMPPAPAHAAQMRVVDGLLTWVDCRTLADARAERWAAMKTARDEQEFGTFVWDGSEFDATPESQRRIEGAFVVAQFAILGGGAFSRDWTLADNTVRTLTAADMVLVGQALVAHVDAAHEAGRLVRERIEAAVDVAAVDAVSWPP